MAEQKRYVIKVYDRETGGEYEFDGEFFTHESERGMVFEHPIAYPNGQERHQFKIWSGMEKWEDFKTDAKKEIDND